MARAQKSVSIEVESKVEGAARGFDRLSRSVAKASKSVDRADSSLKKFDKTSSAAVQSLNNMRNMLMAGGLTGAAIMAANRVDELAERSLKMRGVVMNLAYSIDEARDRTRGLISAFNLMQNANLLNAMGVAKTSKEFANFTEIVTKLSILTGRDLAQTMDKQAAALARNSKKLADDVGIMVDASVANERYAQSINTTVSALSDEQKSMAWRAEYMRQAIELTKNVQIETHGLAATYKQVKTWVVDDIEATLMGEKERQAQIRITNQIVQEVMAEGFKNSEAEAKHLAKKLAMYQKLGWVLRDYTAPSVEQLTAEYVRMRESADRGYESFYLFITDSRSLTQMATEGVDSWIDKLKEAYTAAEKAHKSFPVIPGQYMMQSPEERASRRKERDKRSKKKRRGGGDGKSLLERELMDFQPGGEDAEEAWAEAFGMQGITADPFAHAERMQEIEEAKAEAQLNVRMRAVEDQRAAGVDPLTLIQMEEEAQLEHLDFLINEIEPGTAEHIRLLDERRQVTHEAHLKRLGAERVAEQKMLQRRKMIFAATSNAAVGAAQVMEAAARAAGKGEAKAHAIASTILVAVETAKAAAAYASWNIPGGIAHTAAAALAGIAAGQAWAEVGGGGGGGREESLGGGAYGPYGPGGPEGPGGPAYDRGGGGGGGNVPRSPGPPDPPSGGPSGGGGGGTVEVHLHGTYVGSSESAKEEIHRIFTEADRERRV